MRKLIGSAGETIFLIGLGIIILAVLAITFFPAARAIVAPVVCSPGDELVMTSQYCTSTEGGCFELYCEGANPPREVTGVFCAGIIFVIALLAGMLFLSGRIAGDSNKPEVLYPPPEE